jgi:hypothetical protein
VFTNMLKSQLLTLLFRTRSRRAINAQQGYLSGYRRYKNQP